MSHSNADQKSSADLASGISQKKKDFRGRREDATGEAESLTGKISLSQMGTHSVHSKPKHADKKVKNQAEVAGYPQKGQIFKVPKNTFKDLTQIEVQEDLIYQPREKECSWIYKNILYIVQRCLGDQSHSVVLSATDEVLAILKDDSQRDSDKLSDVQYFLGNIAEETFSTLLNYSRQLTDYRPMKKKDEDEEEHKYDQEEVHNLDFAKTEENELDMKKNKDFQEKLDVIEDDDDIDSELSEDEGIKGEGIEKENESKLEIHPSEILDEHWFQRHMINIGIKAEEVQALENQILECLKEETEIKMLNSLVFLMQKRPPELLRFIVRNKHTILFMIKLRRAESSESEYQQVINEMNDHIVGREILSMLQNQDKIKNKDFTIAKKPTKTLKNEMEIEEEAIINEIDDEALLKLPKKVIDLENVQVVHAEQFLVNEKIPLPEGSRLISKPGYEEIFIPGLKRDAQDGLKIVDIASMPSWTHAAFDETKHLNAIQSAVYDIAFKSPENMLICAPTGAGKTFIALLTILNVIANHMNKNGSINKNLFKIVYIAPMKALVSEIVGNLSRRLESYGIQVRELTGDVHLSRAQMDETQIIIATPEKWDIITRKCGEKSYSEYLKLVIIDEIHLLHDTRGPVLETIITRTIRQVENTQEHIRIVGLSATLPNYKDVAKLIRAGPEGIFYFNSSYRPVPLQQVYVGITEKKGIKRLLLMNEILYEKVMERVNNYQIIIFVHSRRETVKTARAIKEIAYSKDDLSKILKEGTASKAILEEQAKSFISSDLKELVPFGIGIHHAGLNRQDRRLVEDLFADKHLQLLISTSTLAWGVNLPAHTVIIKGTQIYSSEEGKWRELSPQDLLQMLGRAGRPLYDKTGEGIIITTYKEIKFYLSLINSQLPIESQFMLQIVDQLNAEITSGSVANVRDGVNWLGYTYYLQRAKKVPRVYGILDEELAEDPELVKHRLNIIHSAGILLDKYGLIKYDIKSGIFHSTSLGRISCNYYIKYPSIAKYSKNINPYMNLIDVIKVFSLSDEFKNIPIRDDEKIELLKLIDIVPVPVKGSPEDPSSKINILLQAYLSRMRLDGFALNADMVYITQSASRIVRALFEIFLRKGWANVAEIALNLAKMIDQRMWSCSTPLRQFAGIPETILQRIEKKEQLAFEHFLSMTQQQVIEVVKSEKYGKTIYKMIQQFPRLELDAYVQPLSLSCLRVEMKVIPKFEWDESLHGRSEPFWIMVVDVDGESLLYYEYFTLKKKKHEASEQIFEFTVPLFKILHPQYFIKVISDRWLQSETQIPISFKNLIPPVKFPECTELLDFKPIPVSTITDNDIRSSLEYLKISELNNIQAQLYSTLLTMEESLLIGAPPSSGKGVCGLLSMISDLQKKKDKSKILFLAPNEEICRVNYDLFKPVLQQFAKNIHILTGNTNMDIKSLTSGQVIFSNAENWDSISRRLRQKKDIEKLTLIVVDQLHHVNTHDSILEICVSRLKRLLSLAEKKVRLIALSVSIANWKDAAEWLGIATHSIFNFHPGSRPIPIEIVLKSFDFPDRVIRLQMMSKHIFHGLKEKSQGKPAIIFTSDRKESRITALDLVSHAYANGSPYLFLNMKESERKQHVNHIKAIRDDPLRHVLEFGIGYLYEGMPKEEKNIVIDLYLKGKILVLVCSYLLVWEISVKSYLVIIADTMRYNGEERRYVDYTISDVLEMIGKAGRQNCDHSCECIVFCFEPKKIYYEKFLFEPLPIESHLHLCLNDHINAEIHGKVLTCVQDCIDWITWSLMYRRLTQNPNYYNLQGVTGQHINDHLSEIVENSIEELEKFRCITIDVNGNLSIGNFGMIASHYYIKTATVNLYSTLADQNLKLKQIIEIISRSSEFEILNMRLGEEMLLKQIYTEVQLKPPQPIFNIPEVKVNLLLQAHFSRIPISSDLAYDQKIILLKMPKLLQALIDVFSSNGWLKPALLSIQLSQMSIQAMWNTDSQLLQLPYLNKERVSKFNKEEVNDISDFSAMEDEDRKKLLSLTEKEINYLAEACNRFPDVQLAVNPLQEQTVFENEDFSITGELFREDSLNGAPVIAPYYPESKEEFWWVILGDLKSNKLYSLKRLPVEHRAKFELTGEISEPGLHELSVYAYCDSYAGCEIEHKFQINIIGQETKGEMEEENSFN